MKYCEYLPPPALAPFIRCVWTLNGAPDASAGADPVLPDGCVEIVLNFGDRFRRHVGNGEVERQPRGIVAGQLTRSVTIEPEGAIDLLGVRFHPWGAAPFLGVAAWELRDTMLGLDDARLLSPTLDRIGDVTTDEDRVALAMRSLIELLPRARNPRRAAAAASALVMSGRSSPVREIAAELGTTTRTVQQAFRDEVGMSPKTLMRLVRLQRAVAIARGAPGRSLSRVALDAGYYDHAHLAHDCLDIAGVTPSALFGAPSAITEVFFARGAA